ncbi:MAG: NosD domain-containing protein [Planctomycetota bacterium]|jgi:parallel beta-helix repeat protein
MERNRTRIVVSVLALAGLLGLAMFAMAGSHTPPPGPPGPTMKTLDEVEPRIPIPASPTPTSTFVVSEPGSYYLTGDRHASGTGIRIDANDVTIDLMGYALIGPDTFGSDGIAMEDVLFEGTRRNVEIRNGTVRDFSKGINSLGGTGLRVVNVRLVSNGYGVRLWGSGHLVKDCTAIDNGDDGIRVANDCIVTGNVINGNGSALTTEGVGCTITGNTAFGNMGGFWVDRCTVTGNTLVQNWTGINANQSIVSGNTLIGNAFGGILVDGDCTVTANNCDRNGVDQASAGIWVSGSGNRVEANNLTNNDLGIEVSGTGNIIIKNTASGNGTNYNIAASNSYGPIVNVAAVGDITGTTGANHPCVNFEF